MVLLNMTVLVILPVQTSIRAESVFLVKGQLQTSAELAVPLTVEPELLADSDDNTYMITKIGANYWMAGKFENHLL